MAETLPLEGRYVLPRVAAAGKCGGTGSGEGISCRRKRSVRFSVVLSVGVVVLEEDIDDVLGFDPL